MIEIIDDDETSTFLEDEIRKWRDKNFPTQTLAVDQLVLTEEVGELSRVIAKMDQNIRGTKEEWMAEAYKEIGDVMISLTNVANSLGVDLISAGLDRWDTISQRDWNKNRIQHGIEKT